MVGISDRGVGTVPLLAPNDFREIRIQDHGIYVVPVDLAAAVARMCQAAHEITEATHGTRVPVYIVGFGQKYIAGIKFVRQMTGKNLKDAKAVCDRIKNDGERFLLGSFVWNKAEQIKAEAEEHDVIVEVPSPLEMLARQAE